MPHNEILNIKKANHHLVMFFANIFTVSLFANL